LDTVFDLVTMAMFAGLVVLFLQRSTSPEPRDHMYQYAPPAIGCAVANYFGNQGEIKAAGLPPFLCRSISK